MSERRWEATHFKGCDNLNVCTCPDTDDFCESEEVTVAPVEEVEGQQRAVTQETSINERIAK